MSFCLAHLIAATQLLIAAAFRAAHIVSSRLEVDYIPINIDSRIFPLEYASTTGRPRQLVKL